MSPSATDLLQHMLEEIDYLLDQRRSVTKAQLLVDGTLQRAFSRSIEVLGKAAKQIPVGFRAAHPEVPWKRIAGMRDRLIHGYFAVDYEIVWDVVDSKLPELRPLVLKMLEDVSG
jgi:uncharacterized protein with HEPN domain